MKNKRNRILIILVVVLIPIAFLIFNKNHKSTLTKQMRDFAVTDTASINKIFLADNNGKTITLERKEKGEWVLNGKYGVRSDALKTLLETIKRVDVKSPVGKKAQDNVVKRIASKAVKCEIYQNNKLTKAYYVGTETQDQTGTYMVMIDVETMETMEKPFITYIPGFEGYLTTRFFTEERAWRDRTIFQYNPNDIKSIRMEVPYNPQYSYELVVNGNNDYQVKMLAGNKFLENIDPLPVKQYLSYFQKLSFESFEVNINQQQIDSVLKTQPINILTVTDNAGKKNTVKFFSRAPKEGMRDDNGNLVKFDNERMDALLDNGKDFVIVQFYMFGKVMPQPDYFQKSSAIKPKI